jgi:PadR family transcriptional regulator, regulatory protein PadR
MEDLIPGMGMQLLKGTLDTLILRTLSWQSLHGYGVAKWIRDQSNDLLKVEEGALYPALRRLEERGLIESEWLVTETGRDAKYYSLTPAGRQQLRKELRDWNQYVAAMTRVLQARPTRS